MTRSLGRLVVVALGVILSVSLFISAAYADDLQSPNYKFTESTVGNGGLVKSDSANFQSTESIGDTAIGNSSSSNFQVNAGNKTTDLPGLGFSVNSSNANFGNFSATTTATATATFSVSDYTSYGYVVQILGNPPSNGAHTITAMSSTASPSIGQEQFGINVVANTSPSAFGANPDQGQFGLGVAATNYNTPNQFRFVSGETIASAPKSSGVTNFTISYIVNVKSLTPGGLYTAAQTVVCTGTF